ncbi:MAG: D-inositol 3-phosphate glycosyltransferase [candidate division WS2 bacterium]|nr:D-inositol 3-phosphate glycosyltransferase [Candidatus Psychracetigena formicireducens]
MRIGIDARFAVHNRRGIGNYTLKLIQNLAEIDIKNEYILYTDIDDSNNVLPKKDNFKTKKIFPSNYFLWEQISLPIQAKRDAVEILHCTGNTAPILLDRRIKLVSSIMDVMYLKDYSELPRSASLYQRMGRLYRKVVVPRTAGRISMVLTISEFSKKDIMKHIPEFDNNRIKVVYLAANESFGQVDKILALQKIRNKFGIDCNYILTLGAADPRKNTELVIKKFIELKEENDIKEKLLIVGIPNWKQTKFYDIVQESNFKKDVMFTDFVSEDDMILLYNGASMFLYPSLYEGFGMPVLEAMACGVPVITSNITSMPEIAGDAAILINPRNPEELKNSILTLLNDKKLRNDLRERGFRQAKKFSWKKMAKETLEIYESLRNEN